MNEEIHSPYEHAVNRSVDIARRFATAALSEHALNPNVRDSTLDALQVFLDKAFEDNPEGQLIDIEQRLVNATIATRDFNGDRFSQGWANTLGSRIVILSFRQARQEVLDQDAEQP